MGTSRAPLGSIFALLPLMLYSRYMGAASLFTRFDPERDRIAEADTLARIRTDVELAKRHAQAIIVLCTGCEADHQQQLEQAEQPTYRIASGAWVLERKAFRADGDTIVATCPVQHTFTPTLSAIAEQALRVCWDADQPQLTVVDGIEPGPSVDTYESSVDNDRAIAATAVG